MKVLVQRVSRASVAVANQTIAEIGAGLLVFVGVEPADTEVQAHKLADKVLNLRVFPSAVEPHKAMDRSVLDSSGELLVVSQFTLAADTRKGNRPGFSTAAAPQVAEPLYELVVEKVRERVPVQTGQFGADMAISLINDGPVTLLLES